MCTDEMKGMSGREPLHIGGLRYCKARRGGGSGGGLRAHHIDVYVGERERKRDRQQKRNFLKSDQIFFISVFEKKTQSASGCLSSLSFPLSLEMIIAWPEATKPENERREGAPTTHTAFLSLSLSCFNPWRVPKKKGRKR